MMHQSNQNLIYTVIWAITDRQEIGIRAGINTITHVWTWNF